jgi:hypothetical protein
MNRRIRKDRQMSKMENDCPACRNRALADAMGIDAQQLADIEKQEIEEAEIVCAAWRGRAARHNELCQKLAPSIIDALAPLADQIPEGEMISIRIEWQIDLTLSSKGVVREDHGDLPF